MEELHPSLDRKALMDLAWRRGWVRVRLNRGLCSLEFRGPWSAAKRFAPHIAEELGFGGFGVVNLYNHETMTGFEGWNWEELAGILGGNLQDIARTARSFQVRDSSRGVD